MFNFTATYTDLYELTMAQVYFQTGRAEQPAVFDYFFRKIPFEGGFAVFAGLDNLLKELENLRFDERDLAFLKAHHFPSDFIDYLKDFKFRGTIYAPPEGELIFPTAPIVQVEGNLIEAQLIETILLNILNFQTLIATKASRMKLVADDKKLADFGLRRAHGPAGYYAARAAVIGGFHATSNVLAARDFGLEPSGTMAHAFVQSYDKELEAFRDFAKHRSKDCILLVDTYNTLKSGVPNAITVAKEMELRGERLSAIRLDSGDLAYLAHRSRKMLDEAGLNYVQIAASNQLDEFVIKSLREQKAPIDLFGVGTALVTGKPDAALDGVYKLTLADNKPRIKLSENIQKVSLPGKNQVYRLTNDMGEWIGADVIALRDETHITRMHHPMDPLKEMELNQLRFEPLLHKVMENGRIIHPERSLPEIATYHKERLGLLGSEYKRFHNAHVYKVGISTRLRDERNELIQKLKVNKP